MKITTNSFNNIMLNAAITGMLLCNTPLYSLELTNNGLDENGLAMKLMRAAIANNPNSIVAKISCAKVMLKYGNIKDSRDLLTEVLEIEPDNLKARKLLNELNEIAKITAKNLVKENAITAAKPKSSTNVKGKSYSKKTSKTEKPKKVEKFTPAPTPKTTKPVVKLPTKNEIMMRAKERAQIKEAEKNTSEIAPETAVQEKLPKVPPKSEETELAVTVIGEPLAQPKVPSTISESLENTDDTSNASVINQNAADTKESDFSNNQMETEPMVFQPFVSGKPRKSDQVTSVNATNTVLVSNENVTKDTSIKAFLNTTKNSFAINFGEAISKIENSKLDEAKTFLEKATNIAIFLKDSKKLSEVQLTQAMIYAYECDFEKYGKHIMSLRKAVSDNIYTELSEIYSKGISLKDNNAKLSYSAKLAYTAGHYEVSKNLLKKISKLDDESQLLLKKVEENLEKQNGESLLANGSYLSALNYFEAHNDDVEKGRTYLAIAKSLEDTEENNISVISEKYGRNCLFDVLDNDPNNPKANLYLALYYLDKGDKDKAKEAIRRGLNSHGNDEMVINKLLNLSENL